jgi:DnaK suppressor protein
MTNRHESSGERPSTGPASASDAGTQENQRKAFAKLKSQLLEREDTLRADIVRELSKCDHEQYNTLAEAVADSGEQSVADLLVDVDLAEITRDVGELRAIEAALMRLARGVYGVCVDCDMLIPLERLKNDPSVARCVPCQERFERQSREEKHLKL